MPKDRTRVKIRKLQTSEETQESAQTYPNDISYTDNSWINDDEWSFDAWSGNWSSAGWHEDWDEPHVNSAGSLSLGGFDLGARSSPKRFELEKMNLDTGAAVNTCALNFGSSGAGDGLFYRTASGELYY